MRRRDLLAVLPPLATARAIRSAPRLKITDVRVVPLAKVNTDYPDR